MVYVTYKGEVVNTQELQGPLGIHTCLCTWEYDIKIGLKRKRA